MIRVRHLGRALVVCLLALLAGCTRGAEYRVAGDWYVEPEVAQHLQDSFRGVMEKMERMRRGEAWQNLAPRLRVGARVRLDTDWSFQCVQEANGQTTTETGTWEVHEAAGDKLTVKVYTKRISVAGPGGAPRHRDVQEVVDWDITVLNHDRFSVILKNRHGHTERHTLKRAPE